MKKFNAVAAALLLIALAAFGGQGYSGGGASVPTGACVPYVGATAPGGWYLAYGQSLSSTTDPVLYGLVGTSFGSAGTMPDLRGRVAAGVDAMGGTAANRLGSGATGGVTAAATLGANGGEQSHTLTVAQIPSGLGTFVTSISQNTDGWTGGGPGTVTDTTGTAGGSGTAHNVIQPTLVLNYICKR